MSTIKEETAIKRITEICASSEQSRADVYDRLMKWGFDCKKAERMLSTLEEGGFIDNERFTKSFISDKFRFNKWGRLKIAQALTMRKIPSKVYKPYLNDIDDAEYRATLQHLIESKRRSVRGKDEKDITAKLIRFAASRGFEMRYIMQCLEMPDDE